MFFGLKQILKYIKNGHQLKKNLQEAKKSGSYLVTVSYKINPNDSKYTHFWIINEFPTPAVLPTLSFLYHEIDRKEIVFQDLLRDIENYKGEK